MQLSQRHSALVAAHANAEFGGIESATRPGAMRCVARFHVMHATRVSQCGGSLLRFSQQMSALRQQADGGGDNGTDEDSSCCCGTALAVRTSKSETLVRMFEMIASRSIR